MSQHASQRLRDWLKAKETLQLKAYLCPAGVWTCGWGTTRGVLSDTVWTIEEAQEAFDMDIAYAEALVRKHVTHEMTQGQFDAFVSIFQNVGPGRADRPGVQGRDGIACLRNGQPSTLLRKFNAGDIAGAEAEWPRWCSPGTNYERGLRKRRYEELSMFRGEEKSL